MLPPTFAVCLAALVTWPAPLMQQRSNRAAARLSHLMTETYVEGAENFMAEVNSAEHAEELHVIAKQKNTEDGVDFNIEQISAVKLIDVDEGGMVIEEILCSSTDQRCIAIDLPISWPANMPLSKLGEMRAAYNEIVRKAYCAVANSDTIPPMYVAQQEELNRLMSLMNSEFSRMVKFYALRHASEAIAPMEEVERARLTQLTFEGLTLELTTVDLAVESANGRLERKVWSTSVLFPMPCNDPYEVEEALIRMFAEERPREIADAAYY